MLLTFIFMLTILTLVFIVLTFIVWARRAHNKTDVASQGAPTSSRFMEEKL